MRCGDVKRRRHVGGILSVIKRWVELRKADTSYALPGFASEPYTIPHTTVCKSTWVYDITVVTTLYTSNMAAITALAKWRHCHPMYILNLSFQY